MELSTCSACLQQDKLKRKEVKKKNRFVQAMEDPTNTSFPTPKGASVPDTRYSGAL